MMTSPTDSLTKVITHELAADETARFSPEEIEQLAKEHYEIGRKREKGQTLVRMSLVNGRSFVHVITDDSPFLIDSVSGELNRLKSSIQQIIHPILMVERENGIAVDIEEAQGDPDDQNSTLPVPRLSENSLLESWSIFEVERMLDDKRVVSIVSGVRDVVADVKSAVEDWRPMLSKLHENIATLQQLPEGADIPQEEVDTAVNLLNWLGDDNFTFLGYREYKLEQEDGEDVLIPAQETGLGLLRDHPAETVHLTDDGKNKARDKNLLVLTKTNKRSTVHRNSYLDYVGIKTFDKQGNVNGEHRFIGLYASPAYTSPVREIPLVDEKVKEVMQRSTYTATSHSGKDLMTILETYPRDELFQIDTDTLEKFAREILLLSERRKTRVFVRPDAYGRFVSALVYLPKDRYNTQVRERIEEVLGTYFDIKSIDYETRVTDSALTRLHFMIRLEEPVNRLGERLNTKDLEHDVARAVRSWSEGVRYNLTNEQEDIDSEKLADAWVDAFPESYKSAYNLPDAIEDIEVFENFDDSGDLQHTLEWRESDDEEFTDARLRVRVNKPQLLSDFIPYLHHLGFRVTDERPYTLKPENREEAYIYDIGIKRPEGLESVDTDLVMDSISSRLEGKSESDAYSKLVSYAGITERDAVLFRALSRYLRQVRPTHSYGTIGKTLVAHPEFVKAALGFFDARFNAEKGRDENAEKEYEKKVNEALENVDTLEADAILRALFEIMRGIVRTNFYQHDENGQLKSYVSFKLKPREISVAPDPKPMYEIFVYSPEVEGVHLRFGDIARGGLRWSDRREDFRTEILGLVKAQEVKNAVIIPSGAKGGFYVKNPVSMADREAWMAQGKECYTTFLRGLLDITDNRVGDHIVPPEEVIRLDHDDAYLVVAADKGTASFSDLANSISEEYNFWLKDAFASGGSVGYDHKAMGITARGAWESAKHHFLTLGKNIQKEDFTVVGIGDMSGDVFGNGMLLSPHIQLVAAFDHRDIFIDPNPDSATTYKERERLFEMPRSSWQDFNQELISKGGGIFSREAKKIDLTPEIREALGIEDSVETMTPNELMQAILKAPAEMLYNGGIGTYVKASEESDADAADKSNDAIRVNGEDLRVKVITEGGNLGFTQNGRIEAARKGILINTDAIDNSAGVDCSDHEVNIKILLDRIVGEGGLTQAERNELLASMTDEVADLVLEDNIQQNILLSNDIYRIDEHLPFYCRMMDQMEKTVGLDRKIEDLPTNDELMARAGDKVTLSIPEVSVLAAYAKIELTKALLASDFADDPWLEQVALNYFPTPLREKFAEQISAHPLKKNIICTLVANQFINTAGVTSAFRLQEETNCDAAQAAKAFILASEIFEIPEVLQQIDELAMTVDTNTYLQMHRNVERLVDRAMRRIIRTGDTNEDIQSIYKKYHGMIDDMDDNMEMLLGPMDKRRATQRAEEWTVGGVPEEQAKRIAVLLETFALMDIADISLRYKVSPDLVARCYFMLSERYGMDSLLHHVSALPRVDKWQALARASLREDLYASVAQICSQIIGELGSDVTEDEAAQHIAEWEKSHSAQLKQLQQTFSQISSMPEGDMAPLAVALRQLRNIMER